MPSWYYRHPFGLFTFSLQCYYLRMSQPPPLEGAGVDDGTLQRVALKIIRVTWINLHLFFLHFDICDKMKPSIRNL